MVKRHKGFEPTPFEDAVYNAQNMYSIYQQNGAILRVYDFDQNKKNEITHLPPYPEKNWLLSGSYVNPRKRTNAIFIPPIGWTDRDLGIIINPNTVDILYGGTADMWTGFVHKKEDVSYLMSKGWKYGQKTGRKVFFHEKRQLHAFYEMGRRFREVEHGYYPTNQDLLWALISPFLADDAPTMFARARIGEYVDMSDKHGYPDQHFYWNEVKFNLSGHDVLGIFYARDDPTKEIPMDTLRKLQRQFFNIFGFWIGIYLQELLHMKDIEPENHQWKWCILHSGMKPLDRHSRAALARFETRI